MAHSNIMTIEEAHKRGRTTAETTALLAGMIDELASCNNCGEHYPPCDQEQEVTHIYCSWYDTTKLVSYFCRKWETPLNGASKSTPPFWATRDKKRIETNTSNARCLPTYDYLPGDKLPLYDVNDLSSEERNQLLRDAFEAMIPYRN